VPEPSGEDQLQGPDADLLAPAFLVGGGLTQESDAAMLKERRLDQLGLAGVSEAALLQGFHPRPDAIEGLAQRRRKAYVPAAMLLNLQVLDLLEISGSQLRAARSLAMHQTTVSRSYWDLAEQFRLQPGRGPRKVCRWGTSTSMRLATDALHQSLLDGLVGVLQVPPYFHPAADWATLVAQGVIGRGDRLVPLPRPAPACEPLAAMAGRAGGAAGDAGAAAGDPPPLG